MKVPHGNLARPQFAKISTSYDGPNGEQELAPEFFINAKMEVKMKSLIHAVHTFAADDNGVTAIEYGLIAAMVAAGLAIAITFLTDGLNTAFTKIKTTLSM